LTFQSIGEEIVFEDTRYSDEGRCVSFGRHHQALSCVMPGAIWTEARLMTELASHGGDSADYLAALRELVEERFVLREDDQYVWIAFGQDWDFADPDDSRRFDHRILESDLIDPSSWDGRDETFNQYVGGGADSLLRVL
jgi:hypothetical protein